MKEQKMHSACFHRALILAVAVSVSAAAAPASSALMPTAQQNALVQKYCAVCHTDAAKNGGLSLEHFDAATAAPSLTAMLLSKVSGGASLETVKRIDTDASAAALVNKNAKFGAMGAAGIPIPDKATIDALIHAFAVESAGATEWTVARHHENDAEVTASILREQPSSQKTGEAEAYRLIASCNSTTREGSLQVAWSPRPQSGSLAVSVDGDAAVPYRVEGSEKMGNGNGLILHGLAALTIAETKGGAAQTRLPLPTESLAIHDLFAGETVTFSFAHLPKAARQELNACFPSKLESAAYQSVGR